MNYQGRRSPKGVPVAGTPGGKRPAEAPLSNPQQQQGQPQQAQQQQQSDAIDFQPNGRTQTAQVRFSSDRGDVVDVSCPSPAENFMVATAANGGMR